MPSQSTSLDYVRRVNRAIDHVLRNLDRPLPLETVAEAAAFSPFHFHRVFKSLTGESLARFVKRLRLERAVTMMHQQPQRSLTEIALACGFGSSSDFSRSFRQHFGTAPSRVDTAAMRDDRRASWQRAIADDDHRHLLDRLPPGENPDGFTATLRPLPARRVAYVRVPDPFRPGVVENAAARLVGWAEGHGVADGRWLGYMWDDPEVVPHELCRYDVGLELPPGDRSRRELRAHGEIGVFDFPAMRVAEVTIRGPIDLEQRALDWLYGSWLPTSGFAPAPQPCFEAWHGRPFAHGYAHFELDVQLPVERSPAR